MANQTGTSETHRELALAIEIHNNLSDLIKPATAASIKVSSIGKNTALRSIFVSGAFCVGLMIVASLLKADGGYSELSRFLYIIAAAGLGSAFFSLNTAREYLRDGTFNPRLQQDYVLRFVLGVFAGIILGSMPEVFGWIQDTPGGTSPVNNASSGDNGLNQNQLSEITLAFVGGFLPRVVATILTRIGDSLVALFEGSGRAKAAVDTERNVTKRLNKVASDIDNAFADPVNSLNTPQDVQVRVRKILLKAMTE